MNSKHTLFEIWNLLEATYGLARKECGTPNGLKKLKVKNNCDDDIINYQVIFPSPSHSLTKQERKGSLPSFGIVSLFGTT